jgi:Uma2 family endonuclease
MTSLAEQRLTAAEYLEIERAAEFKSEFYAGEMFAMAGASPPHVLITSNVTAELNAQLKGRPCRVYSSDLRVRVSETGLYTYPDVVVVCGEQQFDDEKRDTLLNPTLIVEVLSPATEAYDRGDKFAHYQRLPSLRGYVLIAQDRQRIERYVKQGEGPDWLLTAVSQGAVSLPSIGCELRLADVYDKLDLPEATALRRRTPPSGPPG